MHLSKVSLVNYRNFESAKFSFKPGINTVIGENGSGKTNLFRAIRLLLDSNIYRAAHDLSEQDFHRKKGSWKGHWIIISLEFDELSPDEAIQSLFIHQAAIMSGPTISKASYNLFFRPNKHIRNKLSELKAGDEASLEALQNEISIDDYETVFTGRGEADFTNSNQYREIVGDFKKVIFPSKDSKYIGTKIPHQLSISKEVSFTFVKALRDVVSDFSGNRQNPLLNLLTRKSQQIDKSKYSNVTQAACNLNLDIEKLQDVQDVRNDIQTTISETAGNAYAPASLHIKSDLPSEAEKLLQSLKLFVGETDESYAGDISELSLGGANLIYLTLKLLEFKYQKQKETSINFLLIEEPEAHIHTHIQKTLFENITYPNTQIIYSTHSTQISEVSNINSVNVLARKGKRCESYQPANGLNAEEIRHLQRYLDATRSSLLFARGVVLIEGDAEEFIIPVLFKKVLGVSLDELGVSLINIRSTGFENIACVFHKKRIKRMCSIITDRDKAIGDVTIYRTDSITEEKYKKKMRGSDEAGLARQARLEAYCKDNFYTNTFYAQHTFEVDFLRADNEYEIDDVIDSVYSDDETKTKSRSEIADTDIAISGKRVLAMAKYAGKGWFAILLADKITEITNIPEYILEAIFNAFEDISATSRIKILKHRAKAILSTTYFDHLHDLARSIEVIVQTFENGEIAYDDLMDELEGLVGEEDPILQLTVGA
ncbi:AAA family ATPase [Pseudomonas alliivorans]|nr:AAA family ATPase [Pseudomonas alliivorans]